jgi:TRAP-type C4-dicarboxylate transport system substrate-binding protein
MKKLIVIMMTLTLILTGFTGCGGGGGGAATGGDGGSADTIVLRLASDAPLEHIATGLNEEACKLVEERTEGRVKIDYFPASQLGGYETVYEEIVRGTIDLGQITIPDALDARLGAAYVPYYAKSFE